MKLRHLLLLVPFLALGCAAGTSYELLGYDAIQAADVEAAKGVDAYDVAVRAAAEKDKAEFLGKLGGDVVKIALSKDETPENAAKLAAAVTAAAAKHFADQTEQERRRAAWYEVTKDNLAYIVQVCEDGKAFAIYRADVSAQWKTYLQAQARTRLAKMKGTDDATRPE